MSDKLQSLINNCSILMKCSSFGAQSLVYINDYDKTNASITKVVPCTFCNQYVNNRYAFDNVVYRKDSLSRGTVFNPYIFCEETIKECLNLKEQFMLVAYLLTTYVDIDVRRTIMNMYLVKLRNALSICYINKMKTQSEKNKKFIEECKYIYQNTIMEIRFFMDVNKIELPLTGSGKFGAVIKDDYIKKVQKICKQKQEELETIQTKLYNYNTKLY